MKNLKVKWFRFGASVRKKRLQTLIEIKIFFLKLSISNSFLIALAAVQDDIKWDDFLQARENCKWTHYSLPLMTIFKWVTVFHSSPAKLFVFFQMMFIIKNVKDEIRFIMGKIYRKVQTIFFMCDFLFFLRRSHSILWKWEEVLKISQINNNNLLLNR